MNAPLRARIFRMASTATICLALVGIASSSYIRSKNGVHESKSDSLLSNRMQYYVTDDHKMEAYLYDNKDEEHDYDEGDDGDDGDEDSVKKDILHLTIEVEDRELQRQIKKKVGQKKKKKKPEQNIAGRSVNSNDPRDLRGCLASILLEPTGRSQNQQPSGRKRPKNNRQLASDSSTTEMEDFIRIYTDMYENNNYYHGHDDITRHLDSCPGINSRSTNMDINRQVSCTKCSIARLSIIFTVSNKSNHVIFPSCEQILSKRIDREML